MQILLMNLYSRIYNKVHNIHHPTFYPRNIAKSSQPANKNRLFYVLSMNNSVLIIV